MFSYYISAVNLPSVYGSYSVADFDHSKCKQLFNSSGVHFTIAFGEWIIFPKWLLSFPITIDQISLSLIPVSKRHSGTHSTFLWGLVGKWLLLYLIESVSSVHLLLLLSSPTPLTTTFIFVVKMRFFLEKIFFFFFFLPFFLAAPRFFEVPRVGLCLVF